MTDDLLICTKKGIYCPLGDFYVDPWRKVQRAVITHAHSDHARKGSESYLTAKPGERVLRSRLGNKVSIETLGYGEKITMGEVEVSLHPAGHILGSSQVAVTHKGKTWIASGDYKREHPDSSRQNDPTADPFEPVDCHGFITEATFGLPIYQWPDPWLEIERMNQWWRDGVDRLSVINTYSLGKSQRLLKMLDSSIGDIYVHPAVDKLNKAYIESGVELPHWQVLNQKVFEDAFEGKAEKLAGALFISPSATDDARWYQKIKRGVLVETAMASGWMSLRGGFRKSATGGGTSGGTCGGNFVISDHADWPGLFQTFEDCGVLKNGGRIGVTHGSSDIVAKYLKELGHDAYVLETAYEGEGAESAKGGKSGGAA